MLYFSSELATQYFSECLSTLTASTEDLSPHIASIGSPYLAKVSDSPPLTRAQYDEARQHWPCTFHEDKRVTSLIDGCYFSDTQAEAVRAHLSRTLRVADDAKTLYKSSGDCDACIIVDPKDGTVISVAHDLSQFEENDADDSDHRDKPPSRTDDGFKIRPYYHAPMVAIDLVAASQGGGAYSIPMERFPLMSFTLVDVASPSPSPSGEVYDNEEDDASNNDDSTGSNVTYLCTGYDVYLSKEPCLMCAMSLIHSRIRRLFYRHRSADGALGSKFSIHTLESLNHHFEAFCLE